MPDASVEASVAPVDGDMAGESVLADRSGAAQNSLLRVRWPSRSSSAQEEKPRGPRCPFIYLHFGLLSFWVVESTKKIHVAIGLWIFMLIIVRTAGNFEVLALASSAIVYTIEVVDSQEPG